MSPMTKAQNRGQIEPSLEKSSTVWLMNPASSAGPVGEGRLGGGVPADLEHEAVRAVLGLRAEEPGNMTRAGTVRRISDSAVQGKGKFRLWTTKLRGGVRAARAGAIRAPCLADDLRRASRSGSGHPPLALSLSYMATERLCERATAGSPWSAPSHAPATVPLAEDEAKSGVQADVDAA